MTSADRPSQPASPPGHRTAPGELVSRALAIHAALTGTYRVRRAADRRDSVVGEIALPDSGDLDVDLESVLLGRRSRYHFAHHPMDLPTLNTLLRFAVGLQRIHTTSDGQRHALSTAPAAGGLPVLRTYVVARHVDGLPAGIHRYDMPTHRLITISHGDPTAQLRDAYLQQEFADRAAATLVISASLDVAFSKYDLNHYRTIHIDAGIVVQNLYLVSTALDLACCAVVGFNEDTVAEMISCPPSELPIALFPVGLRDDTTHPS